MSDVLAVFFILLLFGVAFPGLLSAWWLIFPSTVERARQRLDSTLWSCFWLGLALLVLVLIPVLILLALPVGPAKFMGWSLAFLALAINGLGAAGLAGKMGAELLKRSAASSSAGAFVRGAVALELACAFPIIGWAIFFPFSVMLSLGATAFALLGWMPRDVRASRLVDPAPVSSRA